MQRLTRILFFTLSVLLLATSCQPFFDDLSKCKTPRLQFSYTANGTDNVLGQYIESGELFIYDESGRLYHAQKLYFLDLRDGLTLSNIHSGKWRIVAWGNVASHTRLTDAQTPLKEAELYTLPDEKGVYRTTDSLYYADVMLDVPALPEGGVFVVPFAAAHISLDVVVEGFDKVFGTENKDAAPCLTIRPAGTHYRFTDHLETGAPLYIPRPDVLKPFEPTTVHDASSDRYRARFDLLRFEEIADASLLLTNTAEPNVEPLVALPLMQYAAEKAIPVKGVNEVNIPILIKLDNEGGKLALTIEPFEWGSINIRPDGFKK